ncbi:MAG TPA: type 2 lanthipeptide synthetase LanM family protein [Chloroflexia bacterium]|nr:type 2 lanthipeptide synthetase LanM family protein [Chloroflexia bacterium]
MDKTLLELHPAQSELARNPAWMRALTLSERLSLKSNNGKAEASEEPLNLEKGNRRLQRWKKQKPFQTGSYFNRRLAQAGLNENELLALLSEPSESLQAYSPATPAWVQRLAAALEAGANDRVPLFVTDGLKGEEGQVKTLLNGIAPLLKAAFSRMQAILGELIRQYEQPAFIEPALILPQLFNNLVNQLVPRISRTISLELNVARLEGRLAGDTAEERFQSFVRQLGQEGRLTALLLEYPVLARQLDLIIEHWLNYNREFLSHLCADWPELRTTFLASQEPGKLVEISGGAGDVHRAGRSVVKFKFSSGQRLIYKPRNFDLDVHFQELLAWLNERGDFPAFRTLKVINQGDYGWCEFVQAAPCRSEAEVKRFYQRQGGFLALLYALEATDFHYENLIATGEHPVMIDLEALFQPRFQEHVSSGDPAMDSKLNSVLRIGLLPQRILATDDAEGIDLSGLNGKDGQLSPRPALRLQGLGTDELRMVRERFVLPGSSNRPRLGDREVDLLDYTGDLLEGFEKVYRLLVNHRQGLIAGPLARFSQDQTRLLARPTNTYARILQESFHPDLLRDALDRDRFFDCLWVAVEASPQLERLISCEYLELAEGDIPMFTTSPGSRAVFSSRGECIPDFLNSSSLETVLERLRKMDENDLIRQRWMIEASLATVPSGEQHRWKASRLVPSTTPVTPERLLQEACKVGDRLLELVMVDGPEVNWLGVTQFKGREWNLVPAGLDLYNGLPGIILFLAYLGDSSKEARYTELAEGAFQTLRGKVEKLRPYLKSVGGFDGWGSLVYLYTQLGVLWRRPELVDEATAFAGKIAELAGQDESFEFLAGSAGAIASLLALYEVSPSPAVLHAALVCGERLLNGAKKTRTGLGWTNSTTGDVPLAGLSHGNAGVAYSLMALARLSGDSRYEEVAREALAYERSHFVAEKQNWPDLRSFLNAEHTHDKPHYMIAWCHGAAGIGLGRLAMLPYSNDAETRQEIEAAVNTTLAHGMGQNHSLCHGDMGNLELVLSAAQALGNEAYRQSLETLTASVLDSIETQGWCSGMAMGVEVPGLMTGLAGIGYQLLRLAQPEKVPSVLVLAPPAVK